MPMFISELTSDSLNQLQDALQRKEYARTPEDVLHIFATCQTVTEGIELNWGKVNQLLDHGEEGRKLRFILLELSDVIRLAAWVFPQVREKVQNESPPFAGKEEGLRKLSTSIRRVEKIQSELKPLVDWLDALPPQVDPASIPGAGPVEKAEGYQNLDEMLARLKPGEGA